jgi:hypothetical protein
VDNIFVSLFKFTVIEFERLFRKQGPLLDRSITIDFFIFNSITAPTALDFIDFIMNFSQSILKFTQIILNYSFTMLLNAFSFFLFIIIEFKQNFNNFKLCFNSIQTQFNFITVEWWWNSMDSTVMELIFQRLIQRMIDSVLKLFIPNTKRTEKVLSPLLN